MPIPLIIPIVSTGLQIVSNVNRFQIQRSQEKQNLIDANEALRQANLYKDTQALETYASQIQLKQAEEKLSEQRQKFEAEALPVVFAVVVFFLGFAIIKGSSPSK